MEYKVGDIFYADDEYAQRAEFCNSLGNLYIEEIESDENGRRFRIAEVPQPTQDELLNIKRQQRSSLLIAFDKWEKAVLRGREIDDDQVMRWYKALLNLEEWAFSDIPSRIAYYL
ncbi:MAG: hypothetical protein J1G38_06295 [Clostridiales bacterium]|nr:hypothetical protein [Clostridiales bacterium]